MTPAHDYYLPGRKLVENQHAQLVEPPVLPRSQFHFRWNRLTTFDAGYLVPFMWEEVLPGDHWKLDMTAFIRMSPVLFPIFSNINFETFYFYVPNRIMQTNWTKLIAGEQQNPGDSVAVLTPTVTLSTADLTNRSTIHDYWALPIDFTTGTINVSAWPYRAYNQVYNQWFRDQNLQNSVPVDLGDGPDPSSDYTLLRIAKYHDYFTSALPWTQKFTAPTVPLSGFAPVSGLGYALPAAPDVAGASWQETMSGAAVYAHAQSTAAGTQNFGIHTDTAGGNPQVAAVMDPTRGGTFTSPFTGAIPGFMINAFRSAFMIQALYERDARSGTRYTEHLKGHWGIDGQDYRLQRPEYIGGGRHPVMVTPVAQTAPSSISGSVGALGAAGTASGRHSMSYAATEHGVIIGLMAIRSELAYQVGVPRKWTRGGRLTYYVPALAQLGEQPITNGELWYTGGNPTQDAAVFGYQESWHEYRTHTSEVTGWFRSGLSGTLDPWHLAQQFSSLPVLGSTFIQETPPMSRILAAGAAANGQQFIGDLMMEATVTRIMTAYGTPALLGRF